MGYSTHLYAIDLDHLQSVVGSKDQSVLEQILRVNAGHESGERPPDPTKGPRVLVTSDSEIYLNGQLVSVDELKNSLLDPKWTGTMLYLYQADPPNGKEPTGQFAELGSVVRFLQTLGPFFAEHGLIYKKHLIGINVVSSAEGLNSDEDEEPTDEQALAELINGKSKRRGCGHVYGYALENLCRGLGTFLDSVGTDCLRWLEVKTPLSKIRSPVKLPKIDDFPYISYLDADGVQAEVARLQAMDLSYPRDPEVEAERRRFLKVLESAAEKKLGVVGFYY